MRKPFAVLATLAAFLAIFLAGTLFFNETSIDQNSLIMTAAAMPAPALLTTTSATQDDVGAMAISENNSWTQYAQSEPVNDLINRIDYMRAEAPGESLANQNLCLFANGNNASETGFELSAYVVVTGDQHMVMMIESSSTANPRASLKCPMFAEKSEPAMNIGLNCQRRFNGHQNFYRT